MGDFLTDILPGTAPMGGDPLRRAYGGLGPGDNLFSQKRNFVLTFQTDGNLVLYAIDSAHVPLDTSNLNKTNASYSKVIWQAPTGPATECVMQQDGNFVLYGYVLVKVYNPATGETNATIKEKQPIWASNTQGKYGAFLRCQNDGNLVVYWLNPTNNLVYAPWQSSTFAGPR